jgi:hypothetical protein
MKSFIGLVCLSVIGSMAQAQQPQPTPEEKQRTQEGIDARDKAVDLIDSLLNTLDAIGKEVKKQCIVTGVNETKCECLANKIPPGMSTDKELWGNDSSRTTWVAYVTIITIPLPESEILAKLKTENAKMIVRSAFKARYTCN